MLPAERLKEYEIAVDSFLRRSERRERTNELFIALNSLFLTALGVLLLSSNLTTWWVAGTLVLISIFTSVMNQIWRKLLGRYRVFLACLGDYLAGLERSFQKASKDTIEIGGEEWGFGMESYINAKMKIVRRGHGFTQLELGLVYLFLAVYPVITLAVVVLTYLVTNHVLPPLTVR